MKWKEKKQEKTKVVFGFLLFPKTINGETRWLCFAKWRQWYYGGREFISPARIDDEWID